MFVQLMKDDINPTRIAKEMKRSKLIVISKVNRRRITYVACDISNDNFYVETLQGELVPMDIKQGHEIAYIIFLDMNDAINEIRRLTEERDNFIKASRELHEVFDAWSRVTIK